jgi:hypothetical protein
MSSFDQNMQNCIRKFYILAKLYCSQKKDKTEQMRRKLDGLRSSTKLVRVSFHIHKTADKASTFARQLKLDLTFTGLLPSLDISSLFWDFRHTMAFAFFLHHKSFHFDTSCIHHSAFSY